MNILVYIIFSFFFIVRTSLSECDGCSSFASCDVTYVKNNIYGCGGIWSNDGISSASYLCNDGYEICSNYANVKTLGLNNNLCLNLGKTNYFYLSKQDESDNKLYGCVNSHSDSWINIDNTKHDNNQYNSYLTIDNYDAWEYGWYIWDGIGTNNSNINNNVNYNLLNRVRHIYSDITQAGGDIMGGVLCCKSNNTRSVSDHFNDTNETDPTTTQFITTYDDVSTTSDLHTTAKPSNIPTLKPTVLPTYGLTPGNCCHAYYPDRYELRCNFLNTKSLCDDVTEARRCYWVANDCEDNHITPSPTISLSKCSCTGPGERKRYACEQLRDESTCKFQDCDWECS